MITFTTDFFYTYVNQLFWPFVRILALFSIAPFFAEKQIPKKSKIALALMITILISTSLPLPQIPLFSAMGCWILILQVLIGLLMGLTMQIAFAIVRYAGEILGMQMGLSFALFVDPSAGPNMPIIARFVNLLLLLLFLSFDIHLWLLSLLADSFQTIPLLSSLNSNSFILVAQSAGIIFYYGLLLALPILTLLLIINISLAILNRMTPQLSIFVVGFPLTLLIGIYLLPLLTTIVTKYAEKIFNDILGQLTLILLTLAGK
ncbi:flagellar biosynthetic protein FliR [Candidatus Arsenophonus nilaparvatae]|uniref:flagellar biosynthetic protein FliR n=1 Tax=Candidatus Arsenophonus nilaparvatae TaxID=1247023 RepID=UPI0005097261|nr:flagellar biosynthetic protein FliR [Candidatus Arsenophonus nilaparvatae]